MGSKQGFISNGNSTDKTGLMYEAIPLGSSLCLRLNLAHSRSGNATREFPVGNPKLYSCSRGRGRIPKGLISREVKVTHIIMNKLYVHRLYYMYYRCIGKE